MRRGFDLLKYRGKIRIIVLTHFLGKIPTHRYWILLLLFFEALREIGITLVSKGLFEQIRLVLMFRNLVLDGVNNEEQNFFDEHLK